MTEGLTLPSGTGTAVEATDPSDTASLDSETDTPVPELEAFSSRVAPAPEGGEVLVGHCDIDPAGTIYVTWQQLDGDGQDVWLARSVDGGASFEAPIGIETGPEVPMGGWGTSRKPYVAVDDLRVAVVYGTAGDIGSYVVIADTSAPLDFAPAVEVGTRDRSDVEEFIKPVFQPNGNLHVLVHRTGEGVEQLLLSREEDGWDPVAVIEDAEGEPCDCCPHDVRINDRGSTLLTYRNNIDNIRDQFVAVMGEGEATFQEAVPGSSTHWEILGCPVDGPRLDENDRGDQLLVWADPTSGTSRVWISESSDDGASWTGDRRIADVGPDQRRPTIARHADGTISVTMDQFDGPALITSSTDGGETFGGPLEITTEEGPLLAPELCAGGGRTGLVGVTEAGDLYWVGL